jgi:acetyl esterase/lipase
MRVVTVPPPPVDPARGRSALIGGGQMRHKHPAAILVLCFLSLVLVALLVPQWATAGSVLYRDEVFDSVTVTSNIPYGQAVDWQGELDPLYLDLYEPGGDTEPSRPALVWIHGGFFIGGDKEDDFDVDIATRFARRGWVTVSINYRLRDSMDMSQAAGAMADAQHDAQAAVRWLRANSGAYGIDPDRIAVAGFSAGGVTALNVNYNASDPGDSGNPGYPSETSACVDISGWMNVALMEQGEPPALVIHGKEDPWIGFDAALAIVQRAAETGVSVEFHPLEEASHNVWTYYQEDIILWMANFLYASVIQPLPPGQDTDGDGAPDASDNCPFLANPDQMDTDSGGAGDACDPDDDHDSVLDDADNCPLVSNQGQENNDEKRRDNGAGVVGDWASNPAGDEQGDACDPDDDNDGLPDSQEYSDLCPYGTVADSDGDAVLDGYEVAVGTDPCSAASRPVCTSRTDTNGNGFTDCVEHSGYNTCAFAGDTFPGYTACSDPTDSDSDGCPDWIEIVDVNGNRSADSLDVVLITKRAFGLTPPSDSDPVLDIDKNGSVNMMDAFQVVRNSSLVKPHSPCSPEG